MPQEDIQKAIELIEKSEHVVMVIPPHADLDCLAATEALSGAIIQNQKNIGFLSGPESSLVPHRNHLKNLSSAVFPPKEFIVTLDTTYAPVSQLRYDRAENKIDVVFSPKQTSLKKEFVTFKDGKIMGDCVVAIGVEDLDALPETDKAHPDFFTSTPIINLDVSVKNKNYGEVNLIDAERSSLSEIVYDFLSVYNSEPVSSETATLLLAGIFHKTGGLKNDYTNADNLLVSSELLRLGADRNTAQTLSKKNYPLSLAQLTGRSLIRSRAEEGEKIVWSYITAEDFEKTSRNPQDLNHVTSHLNAVLSQGQNLALLWQDPADRQVRITLSGDSRLVSIFRQKGWGDFKSIYLELDNNFSSFKEAEDYLNSRLAEV